MRLMTIAMGSVFLVLLTINLFLLSSAPIGRAKIANTFIRSEWPSDDIPLRHKVFAIPKGYNAPQQVHITQGDYDGKAVIISWVTPEEPGSSKVQYGKSEHEYDLSAEGTWIDYTFGKYKSGYIHHCLLAGLEYSTEYFYKIGAGESAREFWFQTPPKIEPDAAYTFGIVGDLGQTFNSLSTLEHYMQSGGQAVLFVGDLSYADAYRDNGIGIRWDSWGRFVERSTAYQPWIWSAGNHDIDYMPNLGEIHPFKSYIKRYPTPFLASGSTDPLWYAIRRASAHIIVLSSYSPFVTYTPQWIWLRQELSKVNREQTPWLFVVMHVPMYSSNDVHFMEGESMRAAFESWFVQYKVDLIFAGHVHAYERSYRISNIRNDVSTSECFPVLDKSAPVYITVGDGGNQEGLAGKFRDPQPNYSAFREASYGHSILEIKNRTHSIYRWFRNDDDKEVATDSVVFLNQYWQAIRGGED
ncbi:hypothetical protein Sjap_019321 [Stephania japonica]|uniref:Purple acid phosphatase n=1 Tax=Stephania japonica TaxID=461633 RepID=A0AAP0F1D0_9MAGN